MPALKDWLIVELTTSKQSQGHGREDISALKTL